MAEIAPIIVLHPPKAPTDQLRLESFKTFSRLQLILEFKPWLDFSRDYVRRRVESPYFLLWDCICFGAPLNTLLELLGSPTPRHLAFEVDEFDFSLSVKQREEFFASFIQRVQALELQGHLSFGEVLRVGDFTAGLNAGFFRILQTINRILNALHASYPGLFTVPHGASARRVSLVQQLLDTEHKHISKLNFVADITASLYDDPDAAHPSLEGFVINCSRLIPYHNHVLKILSESASCLESEKWEPIFSLHNKKFFTETHNCYRFICANYLTVQNHVNNADLEKKRRELANDLLQYLSAILSRFNDYYTYLLAILEVTSPTNPNSYDGLCTAVYESHKISESISEVGHELRTMWSYQLLGPRFGSVNPLNNEPQGFGNALQDDCLLVDPVFGSFYSVFLFENMLICCTDDSRSDTVNIGNTRYPVKPWEIGPALLQKHPLNIVLSIPTSSLKVLHCIDAAYFEITWGSNAECSIIFYPVVQHQYTQWTSLLEPFVSRVYHSTSIPQYLEDEDGGSVYSGISLLLIDDDFNFPNRHRYSGGARPWSVVGRKAAHSESSSMLGIPVNGNDAKSVLSPTLLPTLFLNEVPSSPLRLNFIPDGDPPPLTNLLTVSQGEHTVHQNHVVNGERKVDHLPDLTDAVIKEGPYPIAHGGYSDVWRATWNRGGGVDDSKIAVKVLRNTTSDPATKEKLIKRLHHEMRIWKQLKHPHVLELCGTVTGFGPYTSMVCPWMKNGSVTKYLESCGDILTVEDRLRLISEVADGLAYLHSHSILHGDLTGSNVLIDDDLHARLCDFGLSTFLLEECQDDDISESIQSVYTSHLGGSVRWADASLFRSLDGDRPPIIGTPNDIYSFGSVMLEILSGRMPYHYIRTDAQVVIQLHQGVKPRRPASTFVDEEQWDLIQKCWKDPPEDRPSASQVVELTRGLVEKHPIITL